MIAMTRSERIGNWFNMVGLALLSFVFFYPFWFILVMSFNAGQDAIRGGIFWWPRVFTLANYNYMFRNNLYLTAAEISIARTVLGTILSILFTATVAFALSRKELPFKRFFTLAFIFTMYFSGGLIPFFLMLRDVDLINRFAVYVVPGLFSVWNMIIMRTSFRSIPNSLVESAMIDGAGYFSIFARVILPLSMPTLAALSLFTAVGHWNDWFAGSYFVQDQTLYPLQTLLRNMLSGMTFALQQNGMNNQGALHGADMNALTPYSVRMAVVVVVVVPIMAIYPFLQRYFVKGALIGSMKE